MPLFRIRPRVLRAALVGLAGSHTRAHIVPAILEGVAFSLKDSFTIFDEVRVPVERIRLGGGVRSALWRQIQADVYGREVETVESEEGAAYGATIPAGVGAGNWSTVHHGALNAVIGGGAYSRNAGPLPRHSSKTHRSQSSADIHGRPARGRLPQARLLHAGVRRIGRSVADAPRQLLPLPAAERRASSPPGRPRRCGASNSAGRFRFRCSCGNNHAIAQLVNRTMTNHPHVCFRKSKKIGHIRALSDSARTEQAFRGPPAAWLAGPPREVMPQIVPADAPFAARRGAS